MNVQLNFPGTDDQLFWFLFNFGLGSAAGSSLVGLIYFAVFMRVKIPCRTVNGINVVLFAFFLCIVFALSSIHRALNLSRVELPVQSTLGFILGLALPIAAAWFLHRNELTLRGRSARNNDL
jgi:hypothetical protein